MIIKRLLLLALFIWAPVVQLIQDASAGNETELEQGPAPTEAENRELAAEENPEDIANLERQARIEEEEKTGVERKTEFDIYSSIRVRYRGQGSDGAWEDGGSRLGVSADHRFGEESFIVGRFEGGFNVLSALSSDDIAEEFKDTAFTRLGYVGLETPATQITVGKNWSTYYEVGAFTDRFTGTGGDASGVFNAQSDGGPTGTGRANNVLQTRLYLPMPTRLKAKPLEMKVQAQHGNPVPFGGEAEYGVALGFSTVFTTRRNNLSLGIAYNHAEIDLDEYPALRGIGIGGSSQSLLLGARSFGDRWYVGWVLARMRNHETTDEGIYFDGWGSELYGQYQLSDRFWFVGGYNALEPDSGQAKAGDYRVRYSVVGLRYAPIDFKRMIYLNTRINDSRNADGTRESNIYTIGIKWDF
jgi:predicted porin